MVNSKLLPTIVSIIVLAVTFVTPATTGETKNNNLRARVETRDTKENTDEVSPNLLPVAIDSETGQIYLAEVDGANAIRAASKNLCTGHGRPATNFRQEPCMPL